MPVAFITGVTGQDGTYLSRALLDDGYDVHGLVRPDTTSAVPDGVNAHTGDIRDNARLGDLVAELQPDELYHLAGQTSVGQSWDDPAGTVEQTGAPIAALLHAVATRSAHTRVVNASSAEIFGLAEAPQNETTPIAPVSPYGAAKALGHFLVASFRGRGVHATSCVLYNHESPLRPPRFVTRKITMAVARIARGLDDTLTLGNLDAQRDWGWAPDYIDAMRRAAAQPTPADYVIGTGVTHSIRDFVATAFATAGIDDWEAHIESDPALLRPADPGTQRADATRARQALGWAPTVDFAGLIERMVRADLDALENHPSS